MKNIEKDTLNFSQQEITINSNWEFVLNDVLNASEINQSKDWQKVNIPHTWN